MLILPKEKYGELSAKIKTIQKHYPMKKFQLGCLYYKLQRWIEDNSKLVYQEDFSPDRVFGLLDYSMNASAYDRKTGGWLPYHGDIYCEVWRWNEQTHRLECRTAWGGVEEKNISVVHQPLIEFP